MLSGFGTARAGHDKEALPLSTAAILWVWALQGYVAMGTAGILWGWALQGYSAVGHCRDTLQLHAAGINVAIEHCRNAWWLGTAGMLGGWALQGYSVVGHCRDTLPLSTAVELRAEGEDNIDFENVTTPLRGRGIRKSNKTLHLTNSKQRTREQEQMQKSERKKTKISSSLVRRDLPFCLAALVSWFLLFLLPCSLPPFLPSSLPSFLPASCPPSSVASSFLLFFLISILSLLEKGGREQQKPRDQSSKVERQIAQNKGGFFSFSLSDFCIFSCSPVLCFEFVKCKVLSCISG